MPVHGHVGGDPRLAGQLDGRHVPRQGRQQRHALKPRYASYVVGAWLLGIVVNLFSSGNGFYDIGARDLVLMVAAFALACLARKWDTPLALERRLHRGS